jgi:hypothetical protein
VEGYRDIHCVLRVESRSALFGVQVPELCKEIEEVGGLWGGGGGGGRLFHQSWFNFFWVDICSGEGYDNDALES